MGNILKLYEFKEYLGKEAEASSVRDRVLELNLRAGEQLVRGECKDNFDQRSYTDELHSGRRNQEHLFPLHLPVAASPLPEISENGADLVVAVGYSTSAHVSLDPETGALTRLPVALASAQYEAGRGVWAEGINNLRIKTYTGGYAADDIPGDLKLLVCFVAAFLWKNGDRAEITVKQRSNQQGSTEFFETLPEFYKQILDRYRRSPYAA